MTSVTERYTEVFGNSLQSEGPGSIDNDYLIITYIQHLLEKYNASGGITAPFDYGTIINRNQKGYFVFSTNPVIRLGANVKTPGGILKELENKYGGCYEIIKDLEEGSKISSSLEAQREVAQTKKKYFEGARFKREKDLLGYKSKILSIIAELPESLGFATKIRLRQPYYTEDTEALLKSSLYCKLYSYFKANKINITGSTTPLHTKEIAAVEVLSFCLQSRNILCLFQIR